MKRTITLYAHSWTGTWQAEILCICQDCRWRVVSEHVPGPVESPQVQQTDVPVPDRNSGVMTLQRNGDHLMFRWAPVTHGWRQEPTRWQRLTEDALPMDLTMKTQWTLAQMNHAKKEA